MRHFQPYSAVLEAVKTSNMLKVTDDGEITRVTPLSDKFSDNIHENRNIHADQTMNRSIYAKGFGEETESTQRDIEELFAPFGEVNAVRLRRHKDGTFKKSVFVEFASEEMAKEFMETETKPDWKGNELLFKSKKEYCDGKVEEIRDGTVRANSPRRERGGRSGGDNWRERKEQDNRNGRDSRGGRGGRGGRGRGRGGRGGRGGRDRDERRPRGGSPDASAKGSESNEKAESNGREKASEPTENKKRAREDEGGEETEAKKAKTDEVSA